MDLIQKIKLSSELIINHSFEVYLRENNFDDSTNDWNLEIFIDEEKDIILLQDAKSGKEIIRYNFGENRIEEETFNENEIVNRRIKSAQFEKLISVCKELDEDKIDRKPHIQLLIEAFINFCRFFEAEWCVSSLPYKIIKEIHSYPINSIGIAKLSSKWIYFYASLSCNQELSAAILDSTEYCWFKAIVEFNDDRSFEV